MILRQDAGAKPRQVVVELGFRGVDAANPGVEIIHWGKFKSLSKQQRKWLKRRQAVEPASPFMINGLLGHFAGPGVQVWSDTYLREYSVSMYRLHRCHQ